MSKHIVKYSTAKVINAPLKEVFDWCTDYRDDDPEKVTGEPIKKKVLEKTSERVVYTYEKEENGKILKQKTTVWLYPPNRWYAEGHGDMWDFVGDYILTLEGKSTRLTVNIEENHNHQNTPSSEELSTWLSQHWDKILKAFHKERG